MQMINSALGHIIYMPSIISNGNSIKEIKPFLENSINDFMNEMDLYLDRNKDERFLRYFGERSFLSMFINAIIRNDIKKVVTGVQEYPVEVDGPDMRCDAWLNYDQNIFIIEAKRQKLENEVLDSNHWDMDAWLKWDDLEVKPQLSVYYNAESEGISLPRYKSCFLMTLVFKVIQQDFKKHFSDAEVNLKSDFHPGQDWFYSVGFIRENESEELLGVEVYGTIVKKK